MNIGSKELKETISEKVKHRRFLLAASGIVAMAIIAALFVDWEDVFDDDGGVFIALASCVLVGVVVFMLWIFNRDCKKATGNGLLATASEKVRRMTLADIKKGMDTACRGISDAKEAIGGGVRSRAVGIVSTFNSAAKAMTMLLREPLPAAWGILCGGGMAVGMFMLACHAVPSGWGLFGICIAVALVLLAAAIFAYFLSACIALVVALMGRRIDLRQMKAVLLVAILAAVVPLGMFVKGCWRAGMDMHENAESKNGEVIVNWHPYKVSLCAKKMGYFTRKGYLAAYRYALPNFDETMEKAGGFSENAESSEESSRCDMTENDEKCRIDYKSNMTIAASRNSSPEIGVGYISLGGFAVIQFLPEEGAVLAKMENNGLANFAAALSGNLADVSEKDELGTVIYVKTPRQYVDGQALAGGVYIYAGVVTYQTANGSTKSVKAFREMDEELAKKKMAADEKLRLEEEERNAKPIEGHSIPPPIASLVDSICGLEFGQPPAEVEKCLGKRIEGRPISENNSSATFMLKKPFRLCDRVKVHYKGEPPFMVLYRVEFMGNVDETVSASSCRDEVATVAKMLSARFKFEYDGRVNDNDGEYYAVIHLPFIRPTENDSRFWEGVFNIRYNSKSSLFTIEYGCQWLIRGHYYDDAKEFIIKSLEKKKTESQKSLNLSADAGQDML